MAKFALYSLRLGGKNSHFEYEKNDWNEDNKIDNLNV